jgi:hypothetical protein
MRSLLLRNRRRTLLALVLVAAGFTAVALAYLTTTGAGNASANVGSISSPSGVTRQQTGADVTITWSAATLSSGAAVDGYRVTRSDGPAVCGTATLVTGLSCTDTNVPAGTYSYTVTAVYHSWTASSAPSASAATIAAPTIASNPSSPSANRAPTLGFGSPGNSHACKLDGGAYASCSSPVALSGLDDGPHTFAVHAVDGASTGPAATYTWTVDTSAPSITATPSNPSANTVPFEFSHTRGSYTFTCQLDDGDYSSCVSPKSYTGLNDGSHTLNVKAVDADGVTTPAAMYAWAVDATAPTVTVNQTGSQPDPTKTLPVSFAVVFSEPVTGFTADDVARSGTAGGLAGSTVAISGSGSTYHVDVAGLTGNGTLTVGIPAGRAQDAAGNSNTASTSADDTVTYDTTAPQTTINTGSPPLTSSTSASFAFSSNEPGSTFECKLDDAAFAGCSSPSNLTGLSEGSHTFLVRATDAAGNTDATPSARTWTITTVAPTQSLALATGSTNVSFDAPTLYYRGGGGSFRLVDTVSATVAGPASAAFPAIGTTGWAHGAQTVTTPTGGPYTSSVFSWTANPSNPTGYAVTATDTAGNTNNTPLTFVNDSTPPIGGALSVNGTAATSGGTTSDRTDASFSISARTDFSEAASATQSGLQSGSLTVQSAKLVDTWVSGSHTISCGAPGSGGPFPSPTTITGTTQPAGIFVTGACYTYTLSATDKVGNSTTLKTTVRLTSNYLYWANIGSLPSVGSANLDTLAKTTGFVVPATGALGLAVDATHVYWSDINGGRIGRAKLDGSAVEPNFMIGIVNPAGLAVTATHLYWSSRATTNIGRAELLNTNNRQANFISVASDPYGLAVDGTHIYWASYGNHGVGGMSTIGRALLNGGLPTNFFITGPANTTLAGAMAVNVDANFVYWTTISNVGGNKIGRAPLASPGSPIHDFITGAANPAGVTVFGGHIYWSNADTGSIGRALLNGTGANNTFLTGLGVPRQLAVGR